MEAMRQFRDVTKRFTAKAKETSKAPFGPKITADLTNLRATQKALNVGDKLPTSLELTLPSGEKLNVNELAKTKPIVLIFFSGNWCPFCSMQLESFSETAEGFANLGAEIIAISPMLDPATSNYVRANNIPYKVVGGTSGQAAMNLFSLNFRPIDEVYVALKTAGVDMTAVHGVEEDFEMPLSATYVINTRGEIAYAFIEDDLASRANVDEVAAAIIRTQRSREKYFAELHGPEKKKRASFLSRLGSVFRKKRSVNPNPNPNPNPKLSSISSRSSFAHSVSSIKTNSTSVSALENAFEYTLENPEFREAFAVYLDKTYCTENLLFYSEAAVYASVLDKSSKKERGQDIFRTFIKPGAELEINIDDTTREEVIEKVKEEKFEVTLYELAAKETYDLMESDSFRKFRRTKEYLDLWERFGSLPSIAPSPYYVSGGEKSS